MQPPVAPKERDWLRDITNWAEASEKPGVTEEHLHDIDKKIYDVVRTAERAPMAKMALNAYLTRIIRSPKLSDQLRNKSLVIFRRIQGINPQLFSQMDVDDQKINLKPKIDELRVLTKEISKENFLELLHALDPLIESFAQVPHHQQAQAEFGKVLDFITSQNVLLGSEYSAEQREKIGSLITKLLELKLIPNNDKTQSVLFGLLQSGISNRTIWTNFLDNGRNIDSLFDTNIQPFLAKFYDTLGKEYALVTDITLKDAKLKSNLEKVFVRTDKSISEKKVSRDAILKVGFLFEKAPKLLDFFKLSTVQINEIVQQYLSIERTRPEASGLHSDVSIQLWRREYTQGGGFKELQDLIYNKLLPTTYIGGSIQNLSSQEEFNHFRRAVEQVNLCADIADAVLPEKKEEVRATIGYLIQKVLNAYSGDNFDPTKLANSQTFLNHLVETFKMKSSQGQGKLQPIEEDLEDFEKEFVNLSYISDLSSKQALDLDLSNVLPQMVQLEALKRLDIDQLTLNSSKKGPAKMKTYPKVVFDKNDLEDLKKIFVGTRIVLNPSSFEKK